MAITSSTVRRAGPSPDEQAGEEDHRGRELREREVALPRHPDPDRRRVSEHRVELEVRAGDEIQDVHDDGERERDHQGPGRMASTDRDTRGRDQRPHDEQEHPVRGDVVAVPEVQRTGEVGGVEKAEHRKGAPLHGPRVAPPAREHEPSREREQRREDEHRRIHAAHARVPEHSVLVRVDEEVGALFGRRALRAHLHHAPFHVVGRAHAEQVEHRGSDVGDIDEAGAAARR